MGGRENLIGMLRSDDPQNRALALEMNRGLHLIDDILADFKPYMGIDTIFGKSDVEQYIIRNGMTISLYKASVKSPITTLPKLPDGLKKLTLLGLNITHLPELPNQLESLSINDNKIEQLPNLPPNLKILDCERNPIKSLPPIPQGLKYLLVDKCKYLTELPELPNGLEKLSVQYSGIPHETKREIKKQFPFAII